VHQLNAQNHPADYALPYIPDAKKRVAERDLFLRRATFTSKNPARSTDLVAIAGAMYHDRVLPCC
jgi:hypothetical protein